MMNSLETPPTIPVAPVQPNQLPIDPTNPLAWILVLTLLLSHTDEVINAVANLIRALKRSDRTQRKRDNRHG